MNEYLSKEGLRQLCIKIRKALQRVPNDNLLDNWYFVGGGSQLGWGHFPINQRGQVEYAANGGYAFDRWKLGYTVSAGKVMITPEGVKLIRNTLDSGVSEISQVLRFAPKDMVTLSILSADNELTTATGKLGVLAGGNSKNGLRFATTTDIVRIRSVGVQELTLVAAKLEEGPVQTLAHKEGGKWVVNRVPDYRTELMKCQAYQIATSNAQPIRLRCTQAATNDIWFFMPLPVTMRAVPTLVQEGTGLEVHQMPGGAKVDGFTFSVFPYLQVNGVYIIAHKENHGLSDAWLFSQSRIIFDANP